MKAYKCDRCGKLFEKYKDQGTPMFFNVTRNPCAMGNSLLDLCPKCNDELQEWVTNDKVHVVCNCADEEQNKLWMHMIFDRDKIIEKTEQWTKEAEEAGMTLTEYLESMSPLNHNEESEDQNTERRNNGNTKN